MPANRAPNHRAFRLHPWTTTTNPPVNKRDLSTGETGEFARENVGFGLNPRVELAPRETSLPTGENAIIHAGGWFLHARLGLLDGTAQHRYSEDELHGTPGAYITGDLIGSATGLLITLVLLILTPRAAKLPLRRHPAAIN